VLPYQSLSARPHCQPAMLFTGTSRFKPIRLLGTGGMGSVYLVPLKRVAIPFSPSSSCGTFSARSCLMADWRPSPMKKNSVWMG
jgi:hypothetical protein